jgi:hypothetical protein
MARSDVHGGGKDPMRVTLAAVLVLYEATGQQQGKGIKE